MNSYEDWTKTRNRFNFIKIKQKKRIFYTNNTLLFNKDSKTYKKLRNNLFLTKTNYNHNSLLFNTEREENKKTINYRNFQGLNGINAKLFKNALKSLRNLSNSKTNFFSNEIDFSNISNINTNKNNNNNNYIFSSIKNESENPKFRNTQNKLNQTGSLLSTKTSQNNTIYFNSTLDAHYHKIANKKLNLLSPLNKKIFTKNSFLTTKNNKKNLTNNIIKFNHRTIEENKKGKTIIINEQIKEKIKLNKGINVKEKEKQDDEDDKLNSSGFDSYNQISLKNLFQKEKIKIKPDILDRVILDYNLRNKDILLNPFYNSFGEVIEDVSQKIKFIKGSIDLVYPKIIQKKYQIMAKESFKKLGLLKSSSQENIKRNNNGIKDNLFTINKYKKASQISTSKYPIYIKLKGKFSPRMYSMKG